MSYKPKVLEVIAGGTGLGSTTINQILYSSATNTIAGLATANSAVLTTNSSGVPVMDTTNFAVLSTGLQLKGNNTNTASPAGFLGENMITAVAGASPTSLTNNTPLTIASVALTAGIWNISGFITYTGSGNVITQIITGISTTTNTLPTDDGINYVSNIPNAAAQTQTAAIPPNQVVLSGNTTYYIVASVLFASGTVDGRGNISATRVG